MILIKQLDRPSKNRFNIDLVLNWYTAEFFKLICKDMHDGGVIIFDGNMQNGPVHDSYIVNVSTSNKLTQERIAVGGYRAFWDSMIDAIDNQFLYTLPGTNDLVRHEDGRKIFSKSDYMSNWGRNFSYNKFSFEAGVAEA